MISGLRKALRRLSLSRRVNIPHLASNHHHPCDCRCRASPTLWRPPIAYGQRIIKNNGRRQSGAKKLVFVLMRSSVVRPWIGS